HAAQLDYRSATAKLNSAPSLAGLQEPRAAQTITGADLVEDMDMFFERKFLAKAPEDRDREWVRMLAKVCWFRMRSLIADWESFAALVKTGDSGLEPKEVALIRLGLNETKRAMDAQIDSMRAG